MFDRDGDARLPPRPQFYWDVARHRYGPGARSRHGLAYDSHAAAVVLFGGIDWTDAGFFGDTWELRDGGWCEVESRPRPSPRQRPAMSYNPELRSTVLFGGQGRTRLPLRDTWTYAAGEWRRWRAGWWGVRPPARCGHAMAFDESAGVTVLFGGVGWLDQSLGDTWLFDGMTWEPLLTPGPGARRYAALAYDPVLRGCVLHGGAADDAGRRAFSDTWLLARGSWERMGAGFETEPRDDHGLAFHRRAGRLVMLEGATGVRGLLVRGERGWEPLETEEPHPRHQCSQLVWADALDGLVCHGGEECHAGRQLKSTRALKLIEP